MRHEVEGLDRILIVEDEGIAAADLSETLSELGYDVVAIASGGEEAIAKAAELIPDIILMDIRLASPLIDGIQAASIIKQQRDVPIVFLTAHSDDETLKRALATQPLGYIVKPFRAPELRCAIELALHKHEIDRKLQGRARWLANTIRSIGDGRLSSPNPVAQALTGWPESSAMGKTLAAILSGTPTPSTDGPPSTPTVEQEILQMNVEVEQRVVERTQQLEAATRELEAFTFSVAHDLRAPLRGIDGFSQILIEEHTGNLGAEGFDHLQRIRGAAHRMGELIDDLLQLAHVARTDLQVTTVDLSELATDVLADLTPIRDVNVTVEPGIVARGDKQLLRVVLTNLLGNAWKFTARSNAAAITFGCTEHAGVPAYYVRDNGVGFDTRHAARLFGAFERLDAGFEGTGLGLAIVQRIVHRHRGEVWAEGEPGRGATFSFTLG